MREKCQHNTNFNNWYAFKVLPQHLEHISLQNYKQWTDVHWMELSHVERYSETSSLIDVLEVNSEVSKGLYVVDVEETSLGEPKDKGLAPGTANTSSPILSLSRYAQAILAALPFLRAPPILETLRTFELHLQWDYGGFRRDHMHCVYDFRRENNDTFPTMYTRLARFVRKSGGVFVESQLINIFLSNIDKRLIDLVLSTIIIFYNGWTTFV